MFHPDKDAASIDQLAAGINANAARAAAHVDERRSSELKRQSFAPYGMVSDPPPEDPTPVQRAARAVEVTEEMAEQVTVIRTASTELQRLASELRGAAVADS